MISQGDIWWADLPPSEGSTEGSTAAFTRPLLVIQADSLNRTAIPTVLCVPLTSNLELAKGAGNVVLHPEETSLDRPSVAVTPQLLAVDRPLLRARAGRVSANALYLVFQGIDTVLGR